MTKQEAIDALKKGEKLSHRYFGDDEYVVMINGRIHDEDGHDIHSEFWQHRSKPEYETDWNIFPRLDIGIAADNYKQEKFEKELTAAGFTKYRVSTLTPSTKLIKVIIDQNQVKDIEKICKVVQLHFQRGN